MKNILKKPLCCKYYLQVGSSNFRIRFLFFLACISLNSCTEFVEVDFPRDQLYTQSVFEEASTANAAMVEVYSKIRKSGVLAGDSGGMPFLLANYTDEVDFYGADYLGAQSFYRNTLTGVNGEVATIWNSTYNQLYCVNAIIDGVTRSKGLNQEIKDQLMGEALLVRALLHFSLTNLFGPIPYVTGIDYKVNQKVSRNSLDEVYAAAKVDVELAVQLLPDIYLTENRTRPNQSVAQALLSRICLYQGKWDEASNAASAVLNRTDLYGTESDLSQIFLNNSTTTVWQLNPSGSTRNTAEGSLYIFTNGPPPTAALSADFMNCFEAGDLRKTTWIKSVTDGVSTWYHPYKYKQNKSSTPSKESSIIFRTAELYLIRAEARVQSGNLTSGKEDLNLIRDLAGLPPTPALTKETLLQAIIEERRVELFTEYGHRFYDLKRLGIIDNVLPETKPGWNSTDKLLPIPELELSLNKNLLPQNLGY